MPWFIRKLIATGFCAMQSISRRDCHFYYPAVVDRGALQIAISTAGLSPSLAQRLRKELEASSGPNTSRGSSGLDECAPALMSKGIDFETRRRILGRLASREVFDRLKTPTSAISRARERLHDGQGLSRRRRSRRSGAADRQSRPRCFARLTSFCMTRWSVRRSCRSLVRKLN